MLNLLNWTQPLIVNGILYNNSSEASEALKSYSGELEILLNPKSLKPKEEATESLQKPTKEAKEIYRVEVKQYMTKKAAPGFDFMEKWNNDNPMPMRVMYGEVLEETKGMYRMKLHGRAESGVSQCCRCLRTLTHPVSMYYGIGPECGGHMHMASPDVLEKLQDKELIFAEADKQLRQVTWEGWVIKSAIQKMDRVGEKEEAVV